MYFNELKINLNGILSEDSKLKDKEINNKYPRDYALIKDNPL